MLFIIVIVVYYCYYCLLLLLLFIIVSVVYYCYCCLLLLLLFIIVIDFKSDQWTPNFIQVIRKILEPIKEKQNNSGPTHFRAVDDFLHVIPPLPTWFSLWGWGSPSWGPSLRNFKKMVSPFSLLFNRNCQNCHQFSILNFHTPPKSKRNFSYPTSSSSTIAILVVTPFLDGP